jgi:hypothetical protein
MQNAHRAKNLAEVEAGKAKVKDDGEWEVSQEVRDSWGVGSSSRSGPVVSYESSYLPFLFATTSDDLDSFEVAPKLRGRRNFNSHGKEVDISHAVLCIRFIAHQPFTFIEGTNPN